MGSNGILSIRSVGVEREESILHHCIATQYEHDEMNHISATYNLGHDSTQYTMNCSSE
jgi:hypothetical protein